MTVAASFGLASALCVVVLGDESGYTAGQNQKMKIAAIEAMWETEPAPATQNQPPSGNNKSIIGCPACDYLFVAVSDTAATNCPNCGQYVSPQSTTIMLSEPAFDLKKAIEQKTFINI